MDLQSAIYFLRWCTLNAKSERKVINSVAEISRTLRVLLNYVSKTLNEIEREFHVESSIRDQQTYCDALDRKNIKLQQKESFIE